MRWWTSCSAARSSGRPDLWCPCVTLTRGQPRETTKRKTAPHICFVNWGVAGGGVLTVVGMCLVCLSQKHCWSCLVPPKLCSVNPGCGGGLNSSGQNCACSHWVPHQPCSVQSCQGCGALSRLLSLMVVKNHATCSLNQPLPLSQQGARVSGVGGGSLEGTSVLRQLTES